MIDMSTWTEAQRAEMAELEGGIGDADDQAATAEARREVARLDPINVLAERRAELEAKRKAAKIAAAELEADSLFRKALLDYGGKERVARVHTEEGSIIMRAMTLLETDDFGARAEALPSTSEKVLVSREAIADTVLYPSREVFNAITTRWPGLWAFLFLARDAMIAGIREDTAKKG